MLHILFLILKIIGIILLAILGILILSLLVVLFVPLRYRMEAEAKGDLKTAKFELKFSWLLHLLAGHVSYKEEKLEWNIRILFKKLNDETTSKQNDDADESPAQEPEETKAEMSEKSVKTVEERSVENMSENLQDDVPEDNTKKSKFEKLKYTIQNVCDKIKMVYEFLKEESHKQTLNKIKKELVHLLVLLKPKKLKGKVRFGMDDPYATGQILAVLSVFYPFYAESIEIYPEFEQKVLEGSLSVKGKIRGIYAVIVAFNIIIDKNVRTTIKDIKTLL